MSQAHTTIRVNAKKISLALLYCMGFLILARLTTELFAFKTGHDSLFGLIRLFDLDDEANLPSYFSALILLFAALLLIFISIQKYKAKDSFKKQWAMLALMFFYMSIDEAASIHEMFDKPVRALLGENSNGVLHFSWVVVFIPVVLVVILYFIKFLLHFPRRTQILLICSAILFLGGAIGMEMLQGAYETLHTVFDSHILWLTTIEESLEMSGVILFNYVLLNYIEHTYQEARLIFYRD